MKGIFIVTLALFLGACASQPKQTVAADQPAVQPVDQTQPSNQATVRRTDRVYLDQYNLIPFQATPKQRGVRVLGARDKG